MKTTIALTSQRYKSLNASLEIGQYTSSLYRNCTKFKSNLLRNLQKDRHLLSTKFPPRPEALRLPLFLSPFTNFYSHKLRLPRVKEIKKTSKMMLLMTSKISQRHVDILKCIFPNSSQHLAAVTSCIISKLASKRIRPPTLQSPIKQPKKQFKKIKLKSIGHLKCLVKAKLKAPSKHKSHRLLQINGVLHSSGPASLNKMKTKMTLITDW